MENQFGVAMDVVTIVMGFFLIAILVWLWKD